MMLQILWELLHIRPGISVIGPRVQEIFTVCLQQKEQWPQAFNYLVKHIPGKIARHPNRPNAPISWPVGVSPAEQTALDACQDKRVRIAQQALAQHQASRGTLPDAVQKDLDKKAKKRDAADLRAMLLVRPQQPEHIMQFLTCCQLYDFCAAGSNHTFIADDCGGQ